MGTVGGLEFDEPGLLLQMIATRPSRREYLKTMHRAFAPSLP